ncbi:dynamin family protein [Symbioplanes lichenis]|uniref:dynamin family protein n=1 Tax=Symbioplanes lichenis TaxID=1629072 RepID=UPI002738E435|nr:dynamin family protein [Actinoplanes lichenis]
MYEFVSRASAENALGELIPLFPGRYGLEPSLREEIETAGSQLGEPVRLAVAGFIKCGKSTLLNGLLGRHIAATGMLETTFKVYELRFGRPEEILVVRGDQFGHAGVERYELARLAELSVRDEAHLDRLRRVSRIVVQLDEPALRHLTLIDTPGLGSVYGEDSAEAERVLLGAVDDATVDVIRRAGHTVDDIHRTSADETVRADAMFYVLKRGLAQYDSAVLQSFLSGDEMHGGTNPLRTVGVLNQCDLDWSAENADDAGIHPMDYNPLRQVGIPAIERFLGRDGQVSRLFHTVLPTAGLVAAGAQCLDEERYGDLVELARVPPETIIKQLSSNDRFRNDAPAGSAIDASRRARLADELGLWGVLLAYRYVRDGCSLAEIRQHLETDSGVAALRQLVDEHFARHSYLMKLSSVLANLRQQAAIFRNSLMRPVGQPDRDRLDHLFQTLDRIEQSETGFAEIEVRRAHHAGELLFTPEDVSHMTRLTGAHGRSCSERLGRSAAWLVNLSELDGEAVAEIAYWRARRDDPHYDAATRRAAGILYDLAEETGRRVRKSLRMLSWAPDL